MAYPTVLLGCRILLQTKDPTEARRLLVKNELVRAFHVGLGIEESITVLEVGLGGMVVV